MQRVAVSLKRVNRDFACWILLHLRSSRFIGKMTLPDSEEIEKIQAGFSKGGTRKIHFRLLNIPVLFMKLTIGKLARLAGVHVETIRYYQRIGLLDQPVKPANGYRNYSIATATRIRFIKRAQQLGFSLKEISDLIRFGDCHCAKVRELAEINRTRIQSRIQQLNSIHHRLETLIECCEKDAPSEHCKLIHELEKG